MISDNITVYQDVFGGFDVAVQIERTAEVMEKVNAVSDFIAALPLTRRENDELVELLTGLVNAVEHDAYLQGAVFGRCWLVLSDSEKEDNTWAEE